MHVESAPLAATAELSTCRGHSKKRCSRNRPKIWRAGCAPGNRHPLAPGAERQPRGDLPSPITYFTQIGAGVPNTGDRVGYEHRQPARRRPAQVRWSVGAELKGREARPHRCRGSRYPEGNPGNPRAATKSHRSDLNRRPLDYESRALPLSYGGHQREGCPGPDSNRDALRHCPLKTACLPVPPPGRSYRARSPQQSSDPSGRQAPGQHRTRRQHTRPESTGQASPDRGFQSGFQRRFTAGSSNPTHRERV